MLMVRVGSAGIATLGMFRKASVSEAVVKSVSTLTGSLCAGCT